MCGLIFVRGWARNSARAAGDGREHGHRVAVLDRGLKAAEEADILVVEVHVDEAAQLLAVHEALAQAAVGRVQVVQQLVQGAAGPFDRLRAAGVAAQDRGDANLNGHVSMLLGQLPTPWMELYGGPDHSRFTGYPRKSRLGEPTR